MEQKERERLPRMELKYILDNHRVRYVESLSVEQSAKNGKTYHITTYHRGALLTCQMPGKNIMQISWSACMSIDSFRRKKARLDAITRMYEMDCTSRVPRWIIPHLAWIYTILLHKGFDCRVVGKINPKDWKSALAKAEADFQEEKLLRTEIAQEGNVEPVGA